MHHIENACYQKTSKNTYNLETENVIFISHASFLIKAVKV